eukprot:NODE_5455_length_704_cov_34.054962_g4600_i0.p1 GENE.NODE_5455_length_704_cov_34.054962_g4600_i0~~NODE_5455_length_704_cov_34.054962_g4600_i0.p1  ORF type:complete len:132 (-),score=3.05 NODE_5455_length_704_cov_34.054962_g4600_i0:59-454(-)
MADEEEAAIPSWLQGASFAVGFFSIIILAGILALILAVVDHLERKRAHYLQELKDSLPATPHPPVGSTPSHRQKSKSLRPTKDGDPPPSPSLRVPAPNPGGGGANTRESFHTAGGTGVWQLASQDSGNQAH